MHKIEPAGEKSAQNKRQEHPILDCNIGRKRKKIEPDILPVEGVGPPVRRLPEKAKNSIPRSNLAKSNKSGEDEGDPGNEKAPGEMRGRTHQERRQWLIRSPGTERRRGEISAPLGEPMRQGTVEP